MERFLADADRRVRPDHVEAHVTRYNSRSAGVNIPAAVRLGVAACQFDRAFVDIDRVYGGLRRFQCERERDGTPAATEIEERALKRGHGRMPEQHGGAKIHAVCREDAIGCLDGDRMVAQCHLECLTSADWGAELKYCSFAVPFDLPMTSPFP